METILDALKAMGKATAREVAARMKIETLEALTMLREYEDIGQVAQVNGSWQLASPSTEKNIPVKPEPIQQVAGPKKLNESMLVDLMVKHGALSSEQMAKALGSTVRAVASTLAMPVNKGRIVREKRGNVFYFSPATACKNNNSTLTPEAQSTAAFVETIPQMLLEHRKPVELTPKFVAGEIRKTKNRLTHLENLRVTVRTLARQKRLLGL